TRLEAAKRILKDRLATVPEEVGVALVAYDVRPEVIQPRTLKRRELLSRLDGVEARPMAGRADLALESALVLAGLETPSAVWHLSDRSLKFAARIAADDEDEDGEPAAQETDEILPDLPEG